MPLYRPALVALFVLTVSSPAFSQVQPAPAGVVPLKPLTTVNQQASYAIGLDFGQRLMRDGAPIEIEAIMRGIRDGLTGAKAELK